MLAKPFLFQECRNVEELLASTLQYEYGIEGSRAFFDECSVRLAMLRETLEVTDAVARLGPAYAVQGNLDPALLFAPWDVIEARVREIVAEGVAAPGHIFNLGHGVLPETDPGVLERVVDLVHEVGRTDGGTAPESLAGEPS